MAARLGVSARLAARLRANPLPPLTGLAAMLGAVFILDAPIFNGLAVALIFGILVSAASILLLDCPLVSRAAELA
jgi:hypothetical protein